MTDVYEELQQLGESSIKLLPPEQMQALVALEIEFHNARIVSLTEQAQQNESQKT